MVVGAMNRQTAKTWAVERRVGFSGYDVTHKPSCLHFWARSKAEAGRDITSGMYERRIAQDLQVKPASRREWYTDPISGVSHLYTGGLFDWRCDLHERVCDPFAPITSDDIRRMAIRDNVDDDVFVLISRAADGRTCPDEY